MPTTIDLFDLRFRVLHERSRAACVTMPSHLLFQRPDPGTEASFGELILRSAGAVEQTFGGITARLWDDPFEWTLPEELSTNAKIIEYIDEVEATRRRGFRFFGSDADLAKQLPAPEELRSILDLLLETLARAEHFQGRAFAVFSIVAAVAPPRP
jgi:hypothetical protein